MIIKNHFYSVEWNSNQISMLAPVQNRYIHEERGEAENHAIEVSTLYKAATLKKFFLNGDNAMVISTTSFKEGRQHDTENFHFRYTEKTQEVRPTSTTEEEQTRINGRSQDEKGSRGIDTDYPLGKPNRSRRAKIKKQKNNPLNRHNGEAE